MSIRSRLTVMLLLTTLTISMVVESSFSHLDSTTIAFAYRKNDNIGLVGDMLDEDEEMMMPSESARRSLNSNDHIAYRALDKNNIPCNNRGESYYNQCNRMSKVNPYRRGCQRATNCQRSNS
ncbi:hypothetical protein P3S67_007823 [Capsicum chacoense]